MTKDERQFFKDLSATVEQTVEEVRGAEENYFSWLQMTTSVFPWVVDLNNKLQICAEQNIAAALDYSHKMSQAKNFEDLARIQTEFMQSQFRAIGEQTKSLGEVYAKTTTDAVSAVL